MGRSSAPTHSLAFQPCDRPPLSSAAMPPVLLSELDKNPKRTPGLSAFSHGRSSCNVGRVPARDSMTLAEGYSGHPTERPNRRTHRGAAADPWRACPALNVASACSRVNSRPQPASGGHRGYSGTRARFRAAGRQIRDRNPQCRTR